MTIPWRRGFSGSSAWMTFTTWPTLRTGFERRDTTLTSPEGVSKDWTRHGVPIKDPR